MIEEKSGVSGAFDGVKSLAQLEDKKEEKEKFPLQYLDSLGYTISPESVTVKDKEDVWVGTATGDILNPSGPMLEFRSLKELEDDLDSFTFVD